MELCADDFALHPLVDQAVQQLAHAGRLSSTSCMTTSPHWPASARTARALRGLLHVGLHFNLTESHANTYASAHSLRHILALAYTGRLRVQDMQPLWRAQLDAFEDAMGTPPDFVDGHQHVHQLPGVREAMLRELARRYGAPSAWPRVRSTVPVGRLWRDPKSTIIALLGGWTLTAQLRRLDAPANRGFAGVYGFDAPTTAAYGARMARWLEQLPPQVPVAVDAATAPRGPGRPMPGSLLMCHPAAGEVPGDPIGAQRPLELAYLASDEFGQLLHRLHVRITLPGQAHAQQA